MLHVSVKCLGQVQTKSAYLKWKLCYYSMHVFKMKAMLNFVSTWYTVYIRKKTNEKDHVAHCT